MESIKEPTLANELIKMAEIDRVMRMKFIKEGAKWDASNDESSTAWLKEVVESKGWLTISLVGTEASNAAWLLVQHSPSLEFMQHCLQLMKSQPNSEVSPANIAFLEDRVLMHEGKPQIYGTQYQGTGDDMKLYPVEDVENVDNRRASVGLETMAENEERMRRLYDNSQKD